MRAFDLNRPDVGVEEDVQIFVNRNPNSPIFRDSFYLQTISESLPTGSFVLRANATDADNDVITYVIQASQTGNAASEYFFINPSTGDILVRKNLRLSTASQFTVSEEQVYLCRNIIVYPLQAVTAQLLPLSNSSLSEMNEESQKGHC